MKTTNQRPAFSMLTAIFVMIIMASIAAYVMEVSGKIVKETTAQYQREQALLYADSYTEYAIMAITANPRQNKCLETIYGDIGEFDKGNGYGVVVRIIYLGTDQALDAAKCTNGYTLDGPLATTQSPLHAIIDVYVHYHDPDAPERNKRTIHKRTLQRI